MHKLLALILLLFSVLTAFVLVAGTPRHHEFLLEQEAVNSNPWVTRYHEFLTELEPLYFNPSEPRSARVLWRKSGFSIFNRGKEDIFWGELPLLDCGGPLSESVFDLLWEEITTEAEDRRVLIPKEKFLREHYFVWDSYYCRRYQLEACAPQVVSLLEREEYWHDYYVHPGVRVSGRNFIWKDSRLVELNLADLFKDSPTNDWYEVLSNEVTAELRRRFLDSDSYFPYEQIYTFLITEKGLKILFQPYEVTTGPYQNFIEVVVSWDLLEPYLKPGAPTTIWYQQLQKQR